MIEGVMVGKDGTCRFCQTCREAALRLMGTPTRAGARTPPIASQQRETLLCFKFLTKECSCIDHGKTCYIAGGAATLGKTFAGSGLGLRV